MIYTLTLNPAIDYYIEMDQFQEEHLNSVNQAYSIMGGKGINVSKVLHNFSHPSVALGFLGGYTGDYIRKSFQEAKMEERFTSLVEDTRINIKMKTKQGETEIAGKAPNISEKNLEELRREIQKIQAGDVLVLAGSLPKTLKEDLYADIIASLPKGVKVVLDSRGEAFVKAVKKGVYLTKPNQKELEEFFDRKIETREELIQAAKELQNLGSENVVVSLGKEGSLLVSQEGVYLGNAPQGKLISSVGAGDSMVAGILYALSLGLPLEEAYAYGIASGSSTAFSVGLTNLEDMLAVKEQVKIESYQK